MKAKKTIEDRFIPEYTDKIEQADFVVYMNKEKKNAIAYTGRKVKRDFFYKFETVEKMEDYCLKWALKTAKYFDKINEEKERTKNIVASDHFKIGDIVFNSWGWEQTNIDYYQVVEITGKKIKVMELMEEREETGFMSGHSVPKKDNFVKDGKHYLLSLKFYGDQVYIVNPESFYYFRKWDGSPKYWSSYA